jgi:transcriptional regulator of acetoin/glycerol metabolism
VVPELRMDGASTVRTEHSRDEVTGGTDLYLRWVAGCRAGEAIQLGGQKVCGRATSCDIQLEEDGISRQHLMFNRQGPIHVLKDLGSTNGTFLNGRRVQHAPLQAGDVLRVGASVAIATFAGEGAGECIELAPGFWAGPELQTLLSPVRRAASSNLPISLVGRTGTGKERAARAIHLWSGRAGAFHAVNCAAIPAHIAEAELFGYRRGAFTGAERSHEGHLRAANGGTLFLDEIADLPEVLQPKLLRVVEERRVTPLGDSSSIKVDVRIVCAAQKPLRELVAAGRFREDLAARLCGLVVQLPSLAERRCDVAALFKRFLHLHSGGRPPTVAARLVEALCLYPWPQNVRELETVARRLLVVHGDADVLRRSMLPAEILKELPADDDAAQSEGRFSSRREQDQSRLKAALRETGGNLKAAAARLGFSRQRAYRLLEGEPSGTTDSDEASTDGDDEARAS